MATSNEKVILKRGKSSTMPTAKEAGSILIATDTGVAYVDDTDSDRVQLQDPTKLSLDGGTMTGDIDMGNNNITTTHTPSSNSDVANKEYVDSRIKNYYAEDPISIDDDTIKHKEFNAQSGGPSSRQTLTYGGTFVVPNIESDTHGHVTSITDLTMTMPGAPDNASYATNADHATTADSATKADSATVAESADTASKLSTSRTIDGVSFDGSSDITHYGVCSTGASTAAKVVSVTNFVLDTGAEVTVQFNNTNSAAGPTLNVNSTGAKTIYYEGASLTSSTADYIKGGNVYRFVYDGNYYRLVGSITKAEDPIEPVTYTAESPILISENNVISHESFTAQSGGPSSNQNLDFSSTFTVPYIVSDGHGHVTDIVDRTMRLPDEPDSGGGGGTSDITASYPILITGQSNIEHDTVSAGALSVGPTDDTTIQPGSGFTVPYVSTDQWGHVTAGTNHTITLTDEIEAQTSERLSDTFNIDGIATDGSSDVLHFGVCTTSGSTAAKVVDCDGYVGVDGSVIHVQFDNTNTASAPTLNINDSGTRPITYGGNAFTNLQEGCVYQFILADGNYELVSTGAAGEVSVSVSTTAPISVSGTTSGSNIDVTIGHNTSGVTSGTYGPTSDVSPESGESFSVPSLTVDTYGHVTSASTRTVTLPESGGGGGTTSATSVDVTVNASNWTSSGTYNLSVSGLEEDSIYIIGLGTGVTEEQYIAAMSAMIGVTSQSSGRLVLSAFGDLPAVDIPMTVVVM